MTHTQMTPPNLYLAFGISIRSDIEISDLSAGFEGSDLKVSLGTLSDGVLDKELSNAAVFEREGSIVRIAPGIVCYAWRGIGKILAKNGNEVIVDPENGVDPLELSPFLTGAIFGHILHQRGKTVLHGSGVRSDDGAILFLGEKGAGKSTLAAHLVSRGMELVTDDLVPIDLTEGKITTIPGFRRTKLWPDSVRSLGRDPSTLPTVNGFTSKRSMGSGAVEGTSLEIAQIYVLETASEISLTRLEEQRALIELIKNTYLGRYLAATDSQEDNLLKCAAIAKSVPVFSLTKPPDFAAIPLVCDEIRKQMDS